TAAGGTSAISGTCTVGGTASVDLCNRVTIPTTGRTPDSATANDNASAPTNVLPTADLRITKTGSPDPVTVGSQLTYTITVTNDGPSAVTGAVVVDTLPTQLTPVTWSCVVAPVSGNSCGSPASGNTGDINRAVTLNSGATATFTVTGTVSSYPVGGTLSNSASVAAPTGTTDPVSTNNSATASTAVNRAPVAVNDNYNTPVNTPLTVAAPGVLTNDTDADGDSLTAIL